MWIRRSIAAFVTLAFATLLAAPAFAGVWFTAFPGDEEGCCCAKKDEQKQAHLDAPACECASCACAFEKGKDLAPIYPLSVEGAAPLAATTTQTTTTWVKPALRSVRASSVGAPRGPPGHGAEPLYILYDTLLI